MNTLRKSRGPAALALALATGLLATTLLTPTLRAQSSSTQEKMSLMVGAIQAREDGNLAQAKDYLQRLLVLAPDDPNATQMLAAVNAQLAQQGAGATTTSTTTAAAPTAAAADPAPANTTAAPAAAPAPAADASATAAVAPAATPAAAPAAAPAPAAPAGPSLSATQQALQAQLSKQSADIAAAQQTIAQAQQASNAGQYDQARQLLTQLQTQLPAGIAYDPVRSQATQALGGVIMAQAQDAYSNQKNAAAQDYLNQYIAVVGNDDSAQSFQAKLNAAAKNPYRQDIDAISPGFEKTQDEINKLLVQGRAQYLYGDYDAALATFGKVITEDPDNMEAKGMQTQIYKMQYDSGYINRINTREEMLNDVENAWVRPEVYQGGGGGNLTNATNPVQEKMENIIIPQVSFSDVPLSRVVETLSELSTQYDKDGKGVNMVLVTKGAPPESVNPVVNLTLRDQSLESILNNICKTVSYTEEVEAGVVTLRYSTGPTGEMETRDFPMPQATLTRLTGYHGGSGGGTDTGGGTTDPFAASNSTSSDSSGGGGGGGSSSEVTDDLKNFFENAGVDFPDGARLAYDGNKIWVTNKASNLDRLANLLQRYSEIKQVEIETRFLEVQQGVLQELGFQWSVTNPSHPNNFISTGTGTSNLRLLGDAFPSGSAGAQATTITQGTIDPVTGLLVVGNTTSIPQAIPSLPGGINVGAGATSIFSGVLGVLNGYSVQTIVNALEQTQGADLMSAPKVTVLSQKTAQIVVAQQLRYPTEFSNTQSQVGNSGGSINGGGAGVTITAGTPSSFEVEEVGVVMEVTPTVEDDDSISLRLEPRVTEFEGFIEYGGTSVAISSGTTVTVPSGFIQPVFSVRQVRTEVTIFDGATVVLGGLTREQVETVHDSVPVLGDIPLFGKLFQSKGETSQKRNLMIFVTANLISPGGSPARQAFPNLPPGTLFQEPTLVTPATAMRRTPENSPMNGGTPGNPAGTAPTS
jgi:general secretion pathway protein D